MESALLDKPGMSKGSLIHELLSAPSTPSRQTKLRKSTILAAVGSPLDVVSPSKRRKLRDRAFKKRAFGQMSSSSATLTGGNEGKADDTVQKELQGCRDRIAALELEVGEFNHKLEVGELVTKKVVQEVMLRYRDDCGQAAVDQIQVMKAEHKAVIDKQNSAFKETLLSLKKTESEKEDLAKKIAGLEQAQKELTATIKYYEEEDSEEEEESGEQSEEKDEVEDDTDDGLDEGDDEFWRRRSVHEREDIAYETKIHKMVTLVVACPDCAGKSSSGYLQWGAQNGPSSKPMKCKGCESDLGGSSGNDWKHGRRFAHCSANRNHNYCMPCSFRSASAEFNRRDAILRKDSSAGSSF